MFESLAPVLAEPTVRLNLTDIDMLAARLVVHLDRLPERIADPDLLAEAAMTRAQVAELRVSVHALQSLLP
jgi:hypothetical protein